MEKNNNDRIFNILISFAGVAFCIAACFVPAPEGLLADESLSLIQLYKGTQMILYIVAPAVLMALSFIVTASGRIPVLAVLFAIAGGIMYGMSDVSLSMNSQAFSGVLINAIGVILVLTGACLQMFATDRKKTEEDDETREESFRPGSYDSIYMTDIKSAKADPDSLMQPADVTMKLPDENRTDNTVTIHKQQPTIQSAAVTDFYAGIEELFADSPQGSDQNGGEGDE